MRTLRVPPLTVFIVMPCEKYPLASNKRRSPPALQRRHAEARKRVPLVRSVLDLPVSASHYTDLRPVTRL
jgi:hypothetical protein